MSAVFLKRVESIGGAIDVWAQPAEPSFIKGLPEAISLAEKSGSTEFFVNNDNGEPRGVSIDEHVQMMNSAAVHMAAVCAWYRPGKAILTNDQVKAYARKYPDRFIGVASVDISDPVRACAELERAVREDGMKALRIVPWLWNLPPNHKLYYPLLVKCVELDIPFCTQVGHTGPMCPSDPGRPIPYVDEIALTFPKLKIICGHIGYPWTDEAIALAWKYPNVYIDTSAYLPRYYPSQLVHFMKTNGRHKVMFGTNFPQLSWSKCVSQVESLGLNDDVLRAFLRTNALTVFKVSDRPFTFSMNVSLSQPNALVHSDTRQTRRHANATENNRSIPSAL